MSVRVSWDVEPAEGLSRGIAVAAESLYLTNLLLLPAFAFMLLVALYFKHRNRAPSLAASHLTQTLSASLWGGILLVVANCVIVLLGGYDSAYTWMVVIVYFTVIHATLVLFGVVGLAKAMAGQCWRDPIVGRPLSSERPCGERS